MAERVKVYEETSKKGLPIWAWLLPLLLLAALLFYFLSHRNPQPVAVTAAPVAATAYPDLGTVHFDTDQATLTPASQATLDRAADLLKSHPDAHMRVEGYTDATGTTPHNASLSERRAHAVADYLKGKGIDGNRLTGGGFAASAPVASNATDEGKADNRRVELFTAK